MEPFYKRVHIRLIELERKRSWLLDQAGIKASTWSSWEKFDRIPPANRALAVANALGLSLEFLISGRETPFDFSHSNPLVSEISQKIMDMNEPALRRVLTLVNTIRVEESQP